MHGRAQLPCDAPWTTRQGLDQGANPWHTQHACVGIVPLTRPKPLAGSAWHTAPRRRSGQGAGCAALRGHTYRSGSVLRGRRRAKAAAATAELWAVPAGGALLQAREQWDVRFVFLHILRSHLPHQPGKLTTLPSTPCFQLYSRQRLNSLHTLQRQQMEAGTLRAGLAAIIARTRPHTALNSWLRRRLNSLRALQWQPEEAGTLRAGLAVIIAVRFYPHTYRLPMTKAQQPARAAKAAKGGRNTPCRTCCYHSPHAFFHAIYL